MATGPRYKVPFRRRRENRTDYYIRKKLLTSGELRAVVRRSSKNVNIQFVKFGMNGDSVITSATSIELKKLGWGHACSNIPAAYLTGYLAGTKAKKAGIEHAVLDIGMQTPARGAVLFAALAGLVDAGIEIPHGDVLPSEERLNGSHIDESIASNVASVIEAVGGEKPKPKAKPAEKKADKPADKKPAEKKADKKPAEKKPAEKKADKPADKKPAEKKPADKAEKKPAAKKKKEAE